MCLHGCHGVYAAVLGMLSDSKVSHMATLTVLYKQSETSRCFGTIHVQHKPHCHHLLLFGIEVCMQTPKICSVHVLLLSHCCYTYSMLIKQLVDSSMRLRGV